MKNFKITVPQRKAFKMHEVVGGANDVRIEFEDVRGEQITHLHVSYLKSEDGRGWSFILGAESYKQIDRFYNTHLRDKFFNAEDADGMLNIFQKRLKRAVRDAEPKEEVYVEAVEVDEAAKKEFDEFIEDAVEVKNDKPFVTPPEPKKREIRKIQIARPPAVGLEAQIQDLVFNALESEYSIQTLQNKMIELGIEPNRIEVEVKRVDGTKKGAGVQHKEFSKILKTISAGVNIALVGPAGSGKTTTVFEVAKALDLQFYSQSVSAQTGTHEFFGYNDAHGNYVSTDFRLAFEGGGVFLLDEFDAGNPNVLAALNQATANGTCSFADKMVEKHKDFIVVMAGNTFGHGATSEYVGRNKIDAATLDRFAFIYFDYDELFERHLSTNLSWCKIVQGIRKKVADKKIRTIVSPRATFEGAKLIEAGLDIETVKQMLIYKGLTNDEINLIKG